MQTAPGSVLELRVELDGHRRAFAFAMLGRTSASGSCADFRLSRIIAYLTDKLCVLYIIVSGSVRASEKRSGGRSGFKLGMWPIPLWLWRKRVGQPRERSNEASFQSATFLFYACRGTTECGFCKVAKLAEGDSPAFSVWR